MCDYLWIMKLFLERYVFKDYLYLVVFVIFMALEEEGFVHLFNIHMGELLNGLWIVALLVYWLIPRYLNEAKYLKFFLFYLLAIYLGIFIMEVIIEDDFIE